MIKKVAASIALVAIVGLVLESNDWFDAGVNVADSANRAAVAAKQQADSHGPNIAQIAAAYRTACASRGGTIKVNEIGFGPGPVNPEDPMTRLVCVVSYPGADDQRVAINSDGTWDAETAATAREECRNAEADMANAAADGHVWDSPPVYDDRVGVCVRGHQ